jgi:hypothetical protein
MVRTRVTETTVLTANMVIIALLSSSLNVAGS